MMMGITHLHTVHCTCKMGIAYAYLILHVRYQGRVSSHRRLPFSSSQPFASFDDDLEWPLSSELSLDEGIRNTS